MTLQVHVGDTHSVSAQSADCPARPLRGVWMVPRPVVASSVAGCLFPASGRTLVIGEHRPGRIKMIRPGVGDLGGSRGPVVVGYCSDTTEKKSQCFGLHSADLVLILPWR